MSTHSMSSERRPYETIVLEPEEEGDARIVEVLPAGEDRGAATVTGATRGAGDLERAMRATFACEVRADEGDDAKRILRFTLSTEQPGRDGDIIRVQGWQLAHYRKNPVWLWSHMVFDPPIGRGVEVIRDTEKKRLEIAVQFADRETHEFADLVYRLHKARFLRATSVGWLPLEVRRPEEEERAELGLGPFGVVHERAELLEGSSVSVGADRAALMHGLGAAAARGLVGARDLELCERTFGRSRRPSDVEVYTAMREAWENLRRIVLAVEPAREKPAKASSDAELYGDLLDEEASLSRIAEKFGSRTDPLASRRIPHAT